MSGCKPWQIYLAAVIMARVHPVRAFLLSISWMWDG